MKGRNRFPASSRLRTTADYQFAWRRGQRFHTKHFIVIVCSNSAGRPRLGLTVSRKVGHAVCRNRLKRWLREYFRCHLSHLDRPIDISIVAKRQAGSLNHENVRQELHTVMSRLEADCHD